MPTDLKQIEDAVNKALTENKAAATEEVTKLINEKTKALNDENVALKARIDDMEKSYKGLNVYIPKFPNHLNLFGKIYRMDDQGSQLNKAAKDSKISSYNILNKDSRDYYDMKRWAILTNHIIKNREDHEVQDAYKAFFKEREEFKKQLIGAHSKSDEMVEGTTTLGGYWVPDEFSNELILLVKEDSMALQNCNVIQMNTDSLKIGSQTQGLTCYIVGEGVDITASNFTTGEVTLTPKKFCVLTDQISNELIMDSRYDVLSFIGNEMRYALSQKIDYEVINGASGTWSSNIGLFTSAISYEREVSGSPNNSIAGVTPDDFSYMIQYLSQVDARNSQFVFGKLALHYIRTMSDSNNRPIFMSPSDASTMPMRLYGYPISYWNNADVSDAADTTFGVFGDLKQFYIAQRLGGMTIDSDPYNDFAAYTTRFRMVNRWALGLRRAAAFIKISTHA